MEPLIKSFRVAYKDNQDRKTVAGKWDRRARTQQVPVPYSWNRTTNTEQTWQDSYDRTARRDI
jgi:hypothetical protein